jgi:molybdopterin molybdotransferase
MVDVVSSITDAKVLVHGVAMSPGKPTLLARVQGKAIFGLPGHPVSAMIVAQIFLMPFLKFIGGEDLESGPRGRRVEAVLATSVSSAHGREEYIRVKVEESNGGLSAWPVFGKSSMLSTMVKADGLIVVPAHAEGLAQGERVEVILF